MCTSNRAYSGAEGDAITGLSAASTMSSGSAVVAPVAHGDRPLALGGVSTQPAPAGQGAPLSDFG